MKRIVFAVVIFTLFCSCTKQTGPVEGPAEEPVVSASRIPMQSIYYDERQFLMGVQNPRPYECEGTPFGGMVPHHLIATDMIAGFFSMVSEYKENYDTVILISTSHFPQNCGSEVVTAAVGWDTPYGRVTTDQAAVGLLLEDAVIAAEDNPAALEADHGITGLIPYVHYYLPDAKVAALLLANTLSEERLAQVQETVTRLCADGRTLLVVSADFSHYLTPEQAVPFDEETARAIEAFDYRAILRFKDSNVDSPQSLTTLLKTAEHQGLKLQQLDHSSSVEKLPHALSNPVYKDGITTYYVYAAYR